MVLVDFWTYTCINWLRQLPYVRAWAEKYSGHGLVVIGVHTPEFAFEHNPDNVRRAVQDMRVDYPVAIDNDYAVWRAFANHYWPALYFADAQGRIRHHHFGEGEYQQSEMVIQQLLAEAGSAGAGHELVSVDARGAGSPGRLGRPEIARELHRLRAHRELRVPRRRGTGQASRLYGPGEAEAQSLGPVGGLDNGGTGRHAERGRRADRVPLPRPRPAPGHGAGSARGAQLRFRVLIDGQPPGAAHGADVDDQGSGTVAEQRLYQLIRQPGPITDRTFEITFLDPGAQAYVFTFG